MAEFMIQWELKDRLRKALEVGGVTRDEMADELGVTPPTVSRYLLGKITPKRGDLKLWALRCGVPFEWLRGDDTGGPQEGINDRRTRRSLRKKPSSCVVTYLPHPGDTAEPAERAA